MSANSFHDGVVAKISSAEDDDDQEDAPQLIQLDKKGDRDGLIVQSEKPNLTTNELYNSSLVKVPLTIVTGISFALNGRTSILIVL